MNWSGFHSYYNSSPTRHYAWIGDFGGLNSITTLLSHEVTESMTDPNGDAIQVLPRSTSSWNEVCDNEAQNYTAFINGYQVQSFWSQSDGNYAIYDGNSQTVTDDGGDLIVNGDQLGSNYNDTIGVNLNGSGGVLVTLNGQSFSFPYGEINQVTVNTDGGSNSVYVYNTSSASPVTIYGGGSDHDYIGGTYGVQGINGYVSINNPPSYTSLVINDTGNYFSDRSVTVNSTGVYGLAPAPIYYNQPHLSSLSIETGSAGNTFYVDNTPNNSHGVYTYIENYSGSGVNDFNVYDTSSPLILDGGAGFQSVDVGEGSTAGINGYVDVYNSSSSGSSYLYIDDRLDTTGRTANLYNGELLGLGAPAPIYWSPSSTAGGGVTYVAVDGGAGNDLFNVYNTSSLYYHTYLYTGGGSNTVDVFGTTGALQVAGSGTDTMVGPNVASTWNITGANAGNVGNVTFSGIENLTGGTANDTFNFTSGGSVTGKINGGGGGDDWLDYAAYTTPVTVNLATNTATGIGGGIANIRNVRGGQGGDNLTGNSLGNILIGGAGANKIIGGTGRSLLIGGKGKDTVTGNSGGDILIAGYTDYDSSSIAHDLALDSILAEWQSANSYATRISHIKHGGGLNGSNELDWGVTVHDNSIANANKLTGSGSGNWFFANRRHTHTNKKPGEQLN